MTLIPVYRPPQYEAPIYGSRSKPEDVVVDVSPFVLANVHDFGVRVFIVGGDLTDVEFQSSAWDDTLWISVGALRSIVLNAHDSIRVTYGATPPTMVWTAF